MFGSSFARFLFGALVLLHLIVFTAGFFAPYDYQTQYRAFALTPPSRVHFVDSNHRFHLRPFVYRWTLVSDRLEAYQPDMANPVPFRFFVSGSPYTLFGFIHSDLHLFGTSEDAPAFLLGTDSFGRDELSRLIYGGQISLLAALVATAISLAVGIAFGGVAGYYGGWLDEILMRAAEIFMTVPWLFLLLLVRAFLPLDLPVTEIFLLLIGILGVLGWARPARLIRGVVLSARTRDHVLAARGFGASDLYILRVHILPLAASVAATQAALYIPEYVLAEVTLSFFGLGVGEPVASWGNMLSELQQPLILESCWWLFAPALVLVLVLSAWRALLSQWASSDRNNVFNYTREHSLD